MIQMNIVKWVSAGALAIAAVPAIGMARHSHTVTATASPLVLTPVKHTLAAKEKATSSKLVSHKKATKHHGKRHAKKGKHSKKKTKH